MKKRFDYSLTLIVVLFGSLQVKAQTYNYIPDSTFDGNGLMSFIFFNNVDRMYGCDLQPDQKLVMAGLAKNPSTGFYEICVVRLDTNGGFDPSFSGDGVAFIKIGNQVSVTGHTPKVKIAPNGKIAVASAGIGNNGQDMLIAMLDAAGDPDLTFNGNGKKYVDLLGIGNQPDVANALDIDANGNIYAVGTTQTSNSQNDNDFAIIKVNPQGQLVTSFSGDGKLLFNPAGNPDYGRGIKIQADGKIVFGGTSDTNMMIVRIDSTGALDNTFNGTGMATVIFQASSEMGSLTFDQNERIVIAGKLVTANSNIGIARYRSNGTFDPNFGFNGKYVYNIGGFANHVSELYVQSDNKILLAGYADDSSSISKFFVSRVDTMGSIDLSFGGLAYVQQAVIPGNVDEQCNGMTVMADGRIILTGTTVYAANTDEEVAACRLKPVLVTALNELGEENIINAFPNPFSNEIQILSKEKGMGSLVDICGKTIQTFPILIGSNQITTSELPMGMYFIQVDGKRAVKVIKQ
ncbi:MAG: T9SS type A sorting domain-containing protein [Bacteroidetes bacterium]|nr:T9SS type A sorting domain-containing protein [Bacteroidota bacterium]